MKRSVWMIVSLVLLASACGPSPEALATMTAAAWIPTPLPPTPTSTATPVPYDLTVSIVDESGAAIPAANIIFPESGSLESVVANASGQFQWSNLPSSGVTLRVSAQGYLPAQQTETLERGPSGITIVLQRDPYGVLLGSACAAGETLFYMNDFQTGDIAGWEGGSDTQATRYAGPSPDSAGNTVLVFDASKLGGQPTGQEWFGTSYQGGDQSIFQDGVIRMLVKFNVPPFPGAGFYWQEAGASNFGGQDVAGSRYSYIYRGSPKDQIDLHRTVFYSDDTVSDLTIHKAMFKWEAGKWYWVEISNFQGHVQMWVDGALVSEEMDTQPLPPGRAGISPGGFDPANPVKEFIDAVSICKLTAPFVTLPVPVQVP